MNFHSLSVEAFPNNCQKDLEENIWWDESKAAGPEQLQRTVGKICTAVGFCNAKSVAKTPFLNILEICQKVAKYVHKMAFLHILEILHNFAKSVHKPAFLNYFGNLTKCCKICSQNTLSQKYIHKIAFLNIVEILQNIAKPIHKIPFLNILEILQNIAKSGQKMAFLQ